MPRSRSVDFFATKRDLEVVIGAVESQCRMVYTTAGITHSTDVDQLPSALQIPNLGVLETGQYILQPCYLVTHAETTVQLEAIPNRADGPVYAVDQKLNPWSVIFCPGGMFQDEALIPGSVSSCTGDPRSHELLNVFAREIRHRFKKVRTYYVGADATKLLDRGFRLSADVRSPRLYDLAR